MTVKPGVERHVKDCCVIDYETVRSPLEPQALRVLLQCFTDDGSKQPVKMEVGEPNSVCERFKRKILIEVRLDMYKHRQQPLYFACGSLVFLSSYVHLAGAKHVIHVDVQPKAHYNASQRDFLDDSCGLVDRYQGRLLMRAIVNERSRS